MLISKSRAFRAASILFSQVFNIYLLILYRAPEFDMSELESLFSAASTSGSTRGKSSCASGRKSDKIQLVLLLVLSYSVISNFFHRLYVLLILYLYDLHLLAMN